MAGLVLSSAMQNNDIVADRLTDGRYKIRRWRQADGALLPIEGHEDIYDEEEMYRRLNQLRRTGDTYVRDTASAARLVQP
jgi:hypothetical protein